MKQCQRLVFIRTGSYFVQTWWRGIISGHKPLRANYHFCAKRRLASNSFWSHVIAGHQRFNRIKAQKMELRVSWTGKEYQSVREGFTKKSCSSFGFCPNQYSRNILTHAWLTALWGRQIQGVFLTGPPLNLLSVGRLVTDFKKTSESQTGPPLWSKNV